MITVKVKLMSTSGKDGFGNTLFNHLAEGVAEETKKAVKAFKCEKHPTRNSTLVVVSDKRGPKFDKSGFCCKEFADRVSLK